MNIDWCILFVPLIFRIVNRKILDGIYILTHITKRKSHKTTQVRVQMLSENHNVCRFLSICRRLWESVNLRKGRLSPFFDFCQGFSITQYSCINIFDWHIEVGIIRFLPHVHGRGGIHNETTIKKNPHSSARGRCYFMRTFFAQLLHKCWEWTPKSVSKLIDKMVADAHDATICSMTNMY